VAVHHQVAGEDTDLMARVTMGTMRARHQQEAREATAFYEGVAARAEADALAGAAAEAAPCADRSSAGGGGTAGALDERPGGGAGAARGRGAPEPERGEASEGRDARADAAQAPSRLQPTLARLLGASSAQGRRWSFQCWRRRRFLRRAIGRATTSSPRSSRTRDSE
jgi:hypothetical protein